MIASFVHRARRRFLWNEVLAQFAFAAALLMAGVVLLLVLGTQILDWWVIALLVAASFSVGLYRMWRRTPSLYRIAVLVDSRAGLYDALSTALHFNASAPTPVQQIQREQTERLLPTIDLETAIPFTLPRSLYAMGILALVASSLFALRYGLHKQLDLKVPLARIVMDELGFDSPQAREQAAIRKKAGNLPPGAESLDDAGMSHSDKKQPGELDQAPDGALDNVNDPDVNNGDAQTASTKNTDGKMQPGDKASDGEESESGDTGAPGNTGKNDSNNPSGSQDGPQQGEQAAGQQNSSGSNSSLLSKVKEAMSNLLSKATPQPNAGGGQKQSQQQGQQKAGGQKGGEKGAQQQGQKGGEESADAQQGQQAGDSDSAQDAQGKNGGKSADQQASSQPGSGIGKQDGAKDLKAAEQLAAMGKLSEVIGKRAANVSGEMMIEQQSGPQQLHTQYTENNTAHKEAGGEVSRDEVPVALQSYVTQYFEEVRKADKKATKKE